MSTRQVAFAGAVVGVLYAATLSLRGDVAPGIVGGVLAAILVVLVIRRVEEYNAAKRRRMAARRDPPSG